MFSIEYAYVFVVVKSVIISVDIFAVIEYSSPERQSFNVLLPKEPSLKLIYNIIFFLILNSN